MASSLKSIAEALNLSKATISWILSGQGEAKGFSASTIKLVKEYAEQIGYQPNLIARSLSKGATNTIGLIIPAIDDTFYSQMTQAVERQAQSQGYTLIVCSSEGDDKKERQLIGALRSKQVDGLIIAPAKKSQVSIRSMQKDRYPFVLIDRYFPEINTNYVIVNNAESSYQLVKRIIDAGARKIALITTDTHLLVMGKRNDGYRKAIEDAGFDNSESLCVKVERTNYKEHIASRLDELLTLNPDVDGFFFSTHYLALEAIRYFIAKEIDYQRRFHLGCFHTTIALDILAPKMVISMMPINQMGQLAVDTLVDTINQKGTLDIREAILQNELIGG